MEQWLATAGGRLVRIPPRAPNCNAYAERFVRSVKEECLNRLVPLGERHLRTALREFAAHYHHARNHQGLANELIEPPPRTQLVAPFAAGSESVAFSAITIGQPRSSVRVERWDTTGWLHHGHARRLLDRRLMSSAQSAVKS